MRILVEVTEEAEVQPMDGDTAYEKRKGYLLHWGVEFRLIEVRNEDGEMKLVPVYYTVAIIEDLKTGDVNTYAPNQIRILGKEIKE